MKKENVIKVRETFRDAGVKIQVFGDNSNVYDERFDVLIWDDENELLYVIQRAKTQSVFEYSKPEDAVWYSVLEYEIIQYIQSVSDYREFIEILPNLGEVDNSRKERIKDWVSSVAVKRVNAKPGTIPLNELALNNPEKFDAVYGAGAAENYKAEKEGKLVKFTPNQSSLQELIDSVDNDTIIKLDTVLSEEIKIPEDKKVTLDLNGYDFVSDGDSISVKGELVIKDTKSGRGTIALYSPISAEGKDAKVTIQSGTIYSHEENGCCVLLKDGASVEINGGNLRSKGGPIQSNNTTGNMNAVITDGIISAEEGPAIYMPSQGHLKITGGTINGGISLRMGQVDISGGIINAITKSIDNPAEYYSYSGNAWFPDALYIMGGTYKSDDAEYGNSLKLNITGGTFNCYNDQGSDIAIYDLGKVKQDIEVNISSSVKLNKQINPRKTIDVLTLPELGVNNPKPGYNNPKYTGKVVVNKI